MNRFNYKPVLIAAMMLVIATIVALPHQAKAWFIFGLTTPPDQLVMTASQGGNDATANLIVFPTGGVAWHATVTVPWLVLDPTSNPGNTLVKVTAKNSFPAGNYTGDITFIIDSGASPQSNRPRDVQRRLGNGVLDEPDRLPVHDDGGYKSA